MTTAILMNESKTPMCAETCRDQIGIMVLMSCGARNFAKSETGLIFQVSGPRGKLSKIAVTMNAYDTYDVQRLEMNKKTFETVVVETCEGIYCDNLAGVVRDLGDR